MSAASETAWAPRYGSAAQLATSTGLSLKTVRRRLKDGSIHGVRLGRRVLIPLDAIDRHGKQGAPAMATAPAPATVSPHRSVDATGRALPMTDAEIRARAEVAIRALDELAGITDETDTDAVWDEVTRGIDEDRLSDRKRFR
jgi:excisionase family DNA binding protein